MTTGVACGEVVFEAMGADDGPRLVRFHRTLSPRTTYLRFFTSHTELSASEVDRFVHVDHRDREAVVATRDGELVGVGRFDRLSPGAPVAEVAFLVTDELQGRGIGRGLFDRLVERAHDLGVTTFVAEVLPENTRMLKLFRATGRPQTRRFADGVVHVEVDLCR